MDEIFTKIWSLLFGYSIVMVAFIGQNTGVMSAVLRFNADPLLMMIFLLGFLFSVVYIIMIWHMEKTVEKSRVFGLILSLFVGSYALLPVMDNHGQDTHRSNDSVRIALIIIAVSGGMIFLYGIVFGSFRVFGEAFIYDGFAHVLILNFLVLYAISIGLAKHYSSRWKIVFIPVVGFSIFLYRLMSK